MSARFRAALIGLVDTAARRPIVVLLVTLVVTAAALIYTLGHMSIDTSTTEMISPEVPFRQHDIAFTRAFPEFGDTIVAVIDGQTPEQAEQAAGALARALGRDQAHFTAVDFPGGGPFFATHGLLYLDIEQLAELSDRLAAAQPLLAALAEAPDLRGLARFVGLVAEDGEQTGEPLPAELDDLFAAMARVVEAQVAGRPGQLSWRSLMEQPGLDASTRRLLIAQPVLDHTTMAPGAAAIEALRAHAQRLGIDGAQGLELRLTGAAVLDQEELQSVSAGAALASIVTTGAVIVLLVWGLRSFRLILATTITVAIGLILTSGVAALMFGRLNLISVTFAVLFVGLGVDFGIHFGLRYREAIDRGDDTSRALRAAVESTGGALTLSALCAAFGFLAFAPTSYQGLAELGWISASGMLIAWFTTLTLMPALLRLMPVRPRPGRAAHGPVLAMRFSRPLLVISSVAALASCAALPFVRFDFNPLNLKDPASESVATFRDLAENPITSPYGIEILTRDLDRAVALASRLRELEGTGQVITLESFVPGDQDEKLEIIDQLAFYLGPVLIDPAGTEPPTPEQRAVALRDLEASLANLTERQQMGGAGELLGALEKFRTAHDSSPEALAELDQRLTGLLPDLLEQLRQALEAAPVMLADLPPDLRARWIADDGAARVLVQPAQLIDSNAELETFASRVLAVAPTATGTPVILTAASEVVLDAFFEASLIALITITAGLALALHGVRDILLVLAPLALSVLLTAASAVLLDLEFNFANVIVLPLLLGLGVSGAIHVIMRRHEQVESGTHALFATSTPRAVVFSALTTIASFGSLAVSSHRGLESMGLLLTIAILWSLFCTLIFLPSLLAELQPPRQPESRT
jgi:hopanoid biosynthesis associated RND transporter like protein HpnN